MSQSKWKRLERLVASIENYLKPKGAIVKYSHRRRGPDGYLREVDATIEYRIGSVNILIIVECRAWNATQGKPWIEQLVTKRENLGAQQVIAVSSSGFSKPAIEEATKRSIELRLITEVTDEIISGWTNNIHVKVLREKRRLKSFNITYYHDLSDRIVFTSEVLEELNQDINNTGIMVRYRDNKDITVPHAIEGIKRWMSKDGSVVGKDYRDALFKGDVFTEQIKISFPVGEYYNTLAGEKVDVKCLEILSDITF